MAGKKTFVAGEVLTAQDVNDYLMDQSVMVFGGTAARSSAIPTPTEGMMSYRTDDDVVEVFDGSAYVGVGGKILQVVGASTTTSTSTSSATFTDSGLSATITPTSATSKIIVLISQKIETTNTSGDRAQSKVQTLRDAVVIGEVGGAYNLLVLVDSATAGFFSQTIPYVFNYLDSPATTSPVTYKTQIAISTATSIAAQSNSGTSSIVLMEVAG
jgi:hypothetical protein